MSDGPYFSWQAAILHSNLPPTLRHVALTLACHLSDLGQHEFPALGVLAAETGLAEPVVQAALRGLADAGYLAKERLRDPDGEERLCYLATAPERVEMAS